MAVCAERGLTPTARQAEEFAGSVADWPAFADSAAALARLRRRFRLGVITNCDDDLFAASNRRLGEPFEWVITAEQARAYKPSARNFELALERIGRPRTALLHVAQSLFHDHVPAQALGLATAWIDRRHDRAGFGATPAASAMPSLTAPDMATFADMALAA
jgi:2-haloacid dehalogenase